VVEALVKIGKRSGVEYRLHSPISQILLSEDGKRVKGVVLQETGEELTAEVVICNADLVYAYNNLLPATTYSRALSKRETSCSSISFYWGLDTQFPQLSTHNIFLAEHYKESFDSIFKKHFIPDEPSFYVNVPSRVDPKAAPSGCDAVVVLVPVGHLFGPGSQQGMRDGGDGSLNQDWDAMVAAARETVLKTIESRLNVSLGPHIVTETINTPPSWKETFNLDRGAILGLSHSFFNVLSFRPKTRHLNIRNLFFVGASTHPGTGVPIVLAGAKIVSDQVLKQWWRKGPWTEKEEQEKAVTKEKNKLDKVAVLPLLSWLHWVLLLLVGLLVSFAGTLVGGWGVKMAKFGGDW
jgi:phytoene desaturase (3,4-didehydrolycopene-forming)